jgi:hypothetical protein
MSAQKSRANPSGFFMHMDMRYFARGMDAGSDYAYEYAVFRQWQDAYSTPVAAVTVRLNSNDE